MGDRTISGLIPCPRCGAEDCGWSAGRIIEGKVLQQDRADRKTVIDVMKASDTVPADHPVCLWATDTTDREWVCYECAVELKVRQPEIC